VRLVLAPGDPPLGDALAAGEIEETAVQVAVRERAGRPDEAVVEVVRDHRRRAEADDDERKRARDHEDERTDVCEPHEARNADSALEQREDDGDRGRRGRETDEFEREPVASVRRGGNVRSLSCQRLRARRDPDGERRPRPDHEQKAD
jgi:hypothetical protein